MDKLSMCRMCLAGNASMHVISDRNLQEIYEKLTDTPFVTKDRRPMLACFSCYAKLDQCRQLQKSCQEAELAFARLLKKDYEENIKINHTKSHDRLVNKPADGVKMLNESPEEGAANKERTAQSNIKYEIEIKQEPHDYEGEMENDYNSSSNQEYVYVNIEPRQIKKEVEVEQEVPQKQREDIISAPAVKKPKLEEEKPKIDEQKPKHEDTITYNQNKNELTESEHKSEDSEDEKDIGENPYTCDICLRSFSTDYFLMRHSCKAPRSKYYKRGSFKCNVCQSCLSTKSALKLHMRLHTGEKPYKCNVCRYSSCRKGNLVVHMRVHAGGKAK